MLAREAAALTAALVLSVAPVAGQESHRSARGLWLTEAGYAHSVAGTCSDHYPSFQAGGLANLEGPIALGGTFFLGHNEDVVYGPLPRARVWAGDDVGLDVAGGALWGGSRVRPTASLGVSYRDLVTTFVQYERYRDGGCGSPSEDQLFVGVKIGSGPGLVTAAVGGTVAAIVIAVIVSQVEN